MTFKEMHIAKNYGMETYREEGFSVARLMNNQSAIIKVWFAVMVVTFAVILFNF